MSINKDCFITDIQAEVDNITSSCGKEEFMKTALSSCGISDNVQSYVATGNNLPDLFFNPIPDGTFFYVDSLGTPVYSSNCKWYGVDGREYRSDIPVRELYAWGVASGGVIGNIGDGETISRSSPVQEVTSSTNWCQVSGAGNHSLALKTNNTLWAWGSSFDGQLGDGTTGLGTCSPVQEITSSNDWCQVSSGYRHSLALKTTGTLWAWGSNYCGPIGDGTTISRSSPVQEVSSSTNWCQVSGGRFHSLALKTSGSIWSWGDNYCGLLGDGTTISRSSPVQEFSSSTDWCQVEGGGCHSLALKTTGTLWAWGCNFSGQIGDGTNINSSSPVQDVSSSTDWCQVSGGRNHSLALKTNNTLWAWGNNVFGQIGDEATIRRSSPVQEVTSSSDWCQVSAGGEFHSLALKTSGTLWAWGSNFGKLGDGTTTNLSSPVREISSSTSWCQVSAGQIHSLGIKQVT